MNMLLMSLTSTSTMAWGWPGRVWVRSTPWECCYLGHIAVIESVFMSEMVCEVSGMNSRKGWGSNGLRKLSSMSDAQVFDLFSIFLWLLLYRIDSIYSCRRWGALRRRRRPCWRRSLPTKSLANHPFIEWTSLIVYTVYTAFKVTNYWSHNSTNHRSRAKGKVSLSVLSAIFRMISFF